MDQLLPHVAIADEPIENLGERPWDGPDMRSVIPIEAMLGLLHRTTSDVVAYLNLWSIFVKSVGGHVGLTISREGEEQLSLGHPCDAQIRHRSRWLHYLTEDLNGDPERRDLLFNRMIAKGQHVDNRPANPRETTRVIRNWLRWGGRLLINPQGQLEEGGGVPTPLITGTSEEAAECQRAGRAYFLARRRWRTDRQIKRAVRMLGKRTENGWLVLEHAR